MKQCLVSPEQFNKFRLRPLVRTENYRNVIEGMINWKFLMRHFYFSQLPILSLVIETDFNSQKKCFLKNFSWHDNTMLETEIVLKFKFYFKLKTHHFDKWLNVDLCQLRSFRVRYNNKQWTYCRRAQIILLYGIYVIRTLFILN